FCQESPLPRPQFFILKKADADSPEFFDRMAYGLEHAADLLIAPLMKSHGEPGIIATLEPFDFRRGQPFVVDIDSAAKVRQVSRGGTRRDFAGIDLPDLPRPPHEFRDSAIIRKDNQAF